MIDYPFIIYTTMNVFLIVLMIWIMFFMRRNYRIVPDDELNGGVVIQERCFFAWDDVYTQDHLDGGIIRANFVNVEAAQKWFNRVYLPGQVNYKMEIVK